MKKIMEYSEGLKTLVLVLLIAAIIAVSVPFLSEEIPEEINFENVEEN